MLTLFLKGQGHRVTATENGRKCLNAALKDPYDLIISDIDMPEMSGIECAAEIRRAGLDIPIIAITATYPEIIRDDCFKTGMNAFMAKPLNFPELKRLVRQVVIDKALPHPIQ